jgi:hypothetical protein
MKRAILTLALALIGCGGAGHDNPPSAISTAEENFFAATKSRRLHLDPGSDPDFFSFAGRQQQYPVGTVPVVYGGAETDWYPLISGGGYITFPDSPASLMNTPESFGDLTFPHPVWTSDIAQSFATVRIVTYANVNPLGDEISCDITVGTKVSYLTGNLAVGGAFPPWFGYPSISSRKKSDPTPEYTRNFFAQPNQPPRPVPSDPTIQGGGCRLTHSDGTTSTAPINLIALDWPTYGNQDNDSYFLFIETMDGVTITHYYQQLNQF